MPDEDELVQRYDDAHGGLPRARAVTQAIRSLLPAADCLRILDLAVGPATVAAQLPETVMGLDLLAAMLRRAAVHLQVGLHLAGATSFPGYGHPDGVARESIYPVLAFRRSLPISQASTHHPVQPA